MVPTELNKTPDDVLFTLVDAAVMDGDASAENVQPLAPYMTLELLRRVHERIVHLKTSGRSRAAKHKLLAQASLRLMGMPIPPDGRDVDKIGNHLDLWLSRRYIQVERKITNNVKDVTSRTNRKEALKLECCIINGWGGVAEYTPSVADAEHSEQPKARAPYVPYTRSHAPSDYTLLDLKEELNQARSCVKSAVTDVDREKERCAHAKRRFQCAVAECDAAIKLVELGNVEKLEISKQAEKKVKMMAGQMRTERVRLQRESSQALRDAEARMHRLGGQVAAATQEAAMYALREEKLRSELNLELKRAEAEAEKLRKELADLRAWAQQGQRESEQALRDAEARVLRLGSQVAASAQEAAIHAQKEEKLRLQLEYEHERAEVEAEHLRAEMAKLRSDGVRAQRESMQALRDAEAKVLRLGSQTAAAAKEAAIHAQKEERLRSRLDSEQERAEEEAEHLRAEMARLRSDGVRAQRDSLQALLNAEAKVLRLGSQAAAAAQEAATHAMREDQARRREEEVSRELQEAIAGQEYFRHKAELSAKAQREMAKQCLAASAARDAAKETSQKRLQAKQALADKVDELRAQLDTAHEELHLLREREKMHDNAVEKLSQMPSWQRGRKHGYHNQKGKHGGGNRLEHAHRLAILEQHANGTPPSAIGQNIISIVKKAAPWLKPVQPTVREIRQMGFELATLEETLSARRCASAFKVRLLGFDETTDLHQPVITSNVQIQDTEGGEVNDLVLKAAYLATKGATSQALVEQIEENCFTRLRDLLVMWQKRHQIMFPNVPWTGPDPQLCSLHRLAGGGAVMSDTCNAARKTKRLLVDLIQNQAEVAYRTQFGDEAWESLAEEQREEELRVYQLDCHHHLRNIMLGHMSSKQSEYVQKELAQQLQQFASWERMSTQYDQLLRAVYKEFHSGGRYYKGKGADFASWMLEHHPDAFFLHIERADGGRQVIGVDLPFITPIFALCSSSCVLQDLDYDAAVPIYVNRSYLVNYLHGHICACNHQNILEDFLYQALLTNQFIAMSRANAVIDLRISRPHRWLAGKSTQLQNWSPIKMNGVLDLIDNVFQRARDDGSVLLDPQLDIFKPISDTQPLFQEYRNFTETIDAVLSPDGKVRHLHYKRALAEILDPQDPTNRRTQEKTIQYLQVQAAAALEKMYDAKLAIANKLSSQGGANSIEKQAAADSALAGCNATNDATAESVYGAWKYERRRNSGISVRRSSGLAQSRISKSLAYEDAVQHRKARKTSLVVKRRSKSCMFGYFHQLPPTEQVALVEMCRCERAAQRKLDQQDDAVLDSLRACTRKSNSELELESLIKNFALALSFFDRWKQRGVKRIRDVRAALEKLDSDQLRLDWLREQIEMRVVGLGWVEFKTQWSSGSNENVGTVSDLISHLGDILMEEEERPTPDAAAAPIMRRKTFKQLGTPTAQAEELCDQRLSMSMEQLLAAAREKRAELEASLELDTVSDLQPRDPPSLDEALVGRKLEIHWRYWREAQPGERGKKKQTFIWCEGTVVEVSDGTIRKSKRSKESLPAGAVRIRWPADSDFEEKETLVWSILNPSDWNREVHLGWRWAPCELSRVSGNREAATSLQ